MRSDLAILVIEDSTSDFQLIEWEIKCSCPQAYCRRIKDYEELQYALETREWDVILCDYKVPGLHFDSVLELLRTRVPEVPVILVSGCLGEEKAITFFKLGIWDFVLKDNLSRLVPIIEHSLREAANRKACIAAERALVESEKRLKLVLNATSDGVWDWDLKTGLVYLSPRYYEMTGYTSNEVIPNFEFLKSLIHPEDLLSALEVINDDISGKAEQSVFDYRMIVKDGSLKWIMSRGRVVERDAEGIALRMVGTITDISARKQAEMALRDSEERLRSIGDNLPDGAIYQLSTPSDGTRRFDYISDSIEKLSGVSAREAMLDAQSLYAQIHADDLPKMAVAEQHSYDTGAPFSAEVRIMHRDGTMRWCSIRSSPRQQMDGTTIWYGVIIDINQRVAAKEILLASKTRLEELIAERTAELRQQTHYLRALIDNVPHLVWMKDTEGRFLAVNRMLAEVNGCDIEDLLGKSDFDVWPRSLAERYRADDEEVMAARSRKTVIEPLPSHPDSYYETSKTPVLDEDGAVLGTVGFSRDISAQKQLQEAQEKARLEAEHLARVRSDFLANMSHEIRTPLNAVLGFAQIGYRDSHEYNSREIFAHILDSGQMLLGIINDILDFSKIEAGKLVLDQQPMNLDDILERCSALIECRAREKGLAFHVRKAPNLPASCKGDCLRLAQVLGNLLSNAVKFTASGEIALDACRENETLVLIVSDTGIGLSETALNQLFLPFEQADGTTTRKFGGTGLGLAISKRLVEMMHGEIRVSSQPGRGSRFEVRIPLVEPSGLAIASPRGTFTPIHQMGRRQRLQGISILAAEDNEINRLVLQDMLEGEGARLVMAENGLQAVQCVRTVGASAFDAILMDIQMPEMDGYEATREIHRFLPNLPIIGLTAHAMAEERERCLATGMVEHIAKPIDLEILVGTLLKHIRNRINAEQDNAAIIEAKAALMLVSDNSEITLVNWPALENRYQKRPDFLLKLLSLTLQTHADSAAKLRDAIHNSDSAQIIFITHSMKGTAGSILATRLANLASQTESAYRKAQDGADAIALQLADSWDTLAKEISAYITMHKNKTLCTKNASEDIASLDWSDIEQLLNVLEPLLAAGDTTANMLFEKSRKLLLQALDGIAEQLGRQIDNYDYEQALETLTAARDEVAKKLNTSDYYS